MITVPALGACGSSDEGVIHWLISTVILENLYIIIAK